MRTSSIPLSALVLAGLMAATSAQATTYVSTDVPKAIPDVSTITSVINIGTHGTITDVDVIFGSITHTWDNDLDIYLISPLGTIVELTTDNGGSGDNYINTHFDSSAATSITAGAAPFTGTFRPEGSLDVLNGQDIYGTWTLRVADDLGGDTGSLNAWSLQISAVPEPGTWALFGLGLLGLGARRLTSRGKRA